MYELLSHVILSVLCFIEDCALKLLLLIADWYLSTPPVMDSPQLPKATP